MKIEKAKVKGSPYLGVFASATEEVCLVPENIEKKEKKKIEEILEVEAVKTSIASSSILGVLVKGIGKKFLVPEIVEEKELEELKAKGIEARELKGNLALGNLIAANEKNALLSTLIGEKERKEIERFWNVKTFKTDIGETDLVGSSVVLTKKGFIVNPKIKEKELKEIEKALELKGVPTTANYGDHYPGNSVLANSKGVLVGEQTSSFEILRIDEAFA